MRHLISFCFRGRTAWPRIFCSLIGHRKPQNLRHDFNSAVSAWKIVIFVSYAHAPAFCVVNIKKTASGETPYFYVQLPCVETPIQSCAEPAHTIIIHSSLFTIHYSLNPFTLRRGTGLQRRGPLTRCRSRGSRRCWICSSAGSRGRLWPASFPALPAAPVRRRRRTPSG